MKTLTLKVVFLYQFSICDRDIQANVMGAREIYKGLLDIDNQ